MDFLLCDQQGALVYFRKEDDIVWFAYVKVALTSFTENWWVGATVDTRRCRRGTVAAATNMQWWFGLQPTAAVRKETHPLTSEVPDGRVDKVFYLADEHVTTKIYTHVKISGLWLSIAYYGGKCLKYRQRSILAGKCKFTFGSLIWDIWELAKWRWPTEGWIILVCCKTVHIGNVHTWELHLQDKENHDIGKIVCE